MTSEEVLDLLDTCGAIQTGHFLLSSGRHSDVYFEKFRALEEPGVAKRLGEAIADRFRTASVDVVLSPAVGGIIIGFASALALGARFVFSEREGKDMRLRRGFQIRDTDRVLVTDDIVTTGKSVREILELVPPGDLAGVACILDRSGAGEDLGVEALAEVKATSWEPDECPLCREGQPLIEPGSRRLGQT